MDRLSFRIAQQFVRESLRRRADQGEFWKWMEQTHPRVRNPNPNGRKDIAAKTLKSYATKQGPYTQAAQQIVRQYYKQYEQGRQEKAPAAPQQSREDIEKQNIDIAKHGKIVAQKVLSTGELAWGEENEGGANQSFIVTLEHDGKQQEFIYKPAEGETDQREGIPVGTYHKREQAAYTVDSLLGGRSIVPVTQTQGDEKGSFQLWADGAKQLTKDEDLEDLRKHVSPEQLVQNEDYQRLQVLDVLLGHEDRHEGNLLYYFDGEKKPENLRLVAIDNGLSLGGESGGEKVIEDAFNKFIPISEEVQGKAQQYMDEDRPELANKVLIKEMKSNRERMSDLRGEVLRDIPPALHKQLKNVKVEDMAKALTETGLDDEAAVRGALVRLVALQENPEIIGEFLGMEPEVEHAIADFLNESVDGYGLLESGGSNRVQEIEKAMESAKPSGGWKEPPELSEPAGDIMEDMKNWGAEHGVIEWDKMAASVRDRWLLSRVGRDTRPGRGRTLIVSRIDMETRKPVELATFVLDRDGKVQEKYKNLRFRGEIHQGIRLLGKRFKPKDGPAFMAAVEKVYGHRSLYDVKRK